LLENNFNQIYYTLLLKPKLYHPAAA